jgi:hypothetical protein
LTWGAVIVSQALIACSDASRDERDLELAHPRVAAAREATVGLVVPDTGDCLPPWPATVRLSGVVNTETRLGPPGYGETPSRDKKITIFVLHLSTAVDVCPDTTSGVLHPALDGVVAMQLTGRLDPVAMKRENGLRLTVDGTLHRQTWGTDFTEVLVRVDSILGRKAVRPRSG